MESSDNHVVDFHYIHILIVDNDLYLAHSTWLKSTSTDRLFRGVLVNILSQIVQDSVGLILCPWNQSPNLNALRVDRPKIQQNTQRVISALLECRRDRILSNTFIGTAIPKSKYLSSQMQLIDGRNPPSQPTVSLSTYPVFQSGAILLNSDKTK